MEKAYLFDVASKLYISTDSSPVDMQSVELCSDMIDVVLDVSGIYGMGAGSGAKNAKKQVQVPSLENGDEIGEEGFAEPLSDVGMLGNELNDNDGADDLESPSSVDGAGED